MRSLDKFRTAIYFKGAVRGFFFTTPGGGVEVGWGSGVGVGVGGGVGGIIT